MISFINIYVEFRGTKYPGKLYGDKIVSDECGLTLYKKDVIKYKIHYFKKLIHLFSEAGVYRVSYHNIIIRWFDPFYKVRFVIVSSFVFLPVIAVLIISGKSMLFPTLLFSFFLGLMAYYFFRIIHLESEYIYLKISILLMAICIPVMYWFPFTVYIFASAAGILFFLILLQLAFSRSINFSKYYLSLAWVLLIVFFYFWIITAVKIWAEFNMYKSNTGLILEKEDKSTYTYENILWQKPMDWKISRYSFWQNLLKQKNILWQFSPLPIQLKMATPEFPEFGWMAISSQTPAEVLNQVDSYLDVQKNFLLADILGKSIPITESSRFGTMILQSIDCYDMIEREVVSIHLFLVPVRLRDHQGTMVFTFKIPQGISLNYYLDIIRNGIHELK